MKVHCENCKFDIDIFGSVFFPDGFMGTDEFCTSDNTPEWENPRLNHNLYNDCKCYKRKWWKFWLKQ